MSDKVDSPQWVIMLQTAFRRFLWVLVPTGAWLLLGQTKIIEASSFQVGCMILAAALFCAALPVSAIFRLDLIALEYHLENNLTVFLIALVFVGANFICWGLFGLLWKKFREKLKPKNKLEQMNKPGKKERTRKDTQLH